MTSVVEPWVAFRIFQNFSIRRQELKNLFAVFDTKTRKIVQDGFGLNQKPEAKTLRDKLNEEKKSKVRFVITKGPDHIWHETNR